MSANDKQVQGDHYRARPIQPWDYIAANGLGFFEGNVVKYVTRWRDKGGVSDLEKAQHYLQKLIELQQPAMPPLPLLAVEERTCSTCRHDRGDFCAIPGECEPGGMTGWKPA